MKSTALAALLLSMPALLLSRPLAAQEAPADRSPGLGVYIAGVVVQDVDDGSVAGAGGLRAGDVILFWGGEPVSDVEHLVRLLGANAAGQRVEAKVTRDGADVQLAFQLAQAADGGRPRLGVTPVSGVRVAEVLPGSAAERAGIKSNDVILRWGDEDLTSYERLIELIGKVESGGTRRLAVLRGGSEISLTVTFGRSRRPAAPAPARGDARIDLDVDALVESAKSLGGIEEAKKEIDEAIALVEKAETPEARQRAVTRLKKASDRLAAAAALVARVRSGVDAVKQTMERLEGSVGRWHDRLDDVPALFEPFQGDVPMSEILERVQRLIEEGIDAHKISEMLREEFPKLEIIIGDGSEESHAAEPEAHPRTHVHVAPQQPAKAKAKPAPVPATSRPTKKRLKVEETTPTSQPAK